jgi:hypothetical protein
MVLRTVILDVVTVVAFAHSDAFRQPSPFTNAAISPKRAEELKAIVAIKFDGIDKMEIQLAGALKGSTAIGAIVSESRSDLVVVKDPCTSESAKSPIVFGNPYIKTVVGEFRCAANKRFDKVEVEQR